MRTEPVPPAGYHTVRPRMVVSEAVRVRGSGLHPSWWDGGFGNPRVGDGDKFGRDRCLGEEDDQDLTVRPCALGTTDQVSLTDRLART
jgi:hypothetical protein